MGEGGWEAEREGSVGDREGGLGAGVGDGERGWGKEREGGAGEGG